MEWRIIGLLGGFAPMTLKALALQSGLDKSLASRSIAGLVERSLVLREAGRADAREVALRLTPAGRRLYQRLLRAALKRDTAFAGCLTKQERAVLTTAIRKLEAEARRQTELVVGDAGATV